MLMWSTCGHLGSRKHCKHVQSNGLAMVLLFLPWLLHASTSAAEAATPPSLQVWATVDSVRVDPEMDRYLEDRTDIHADYPTGSYRDRNAVWDAQSSQVSLHAARNEFVAFQVIVGTEKPLSGIQIRMGQLVGPRGATISGRRLALFKAWYVRVAAPSAGYQKTSLGPGWYPDALIPAPGSGAISFDIPDPKNGIGPIQRNQTIWVDIGLPRERRAAPPGVYNGTLEVSSPAGSRRIAVRPSIRLKAHRRGFQDYEYFWLLAKSGMSREAEELVDSIFHVPPFGRENYGNVDIWSHDPQKWDAVRLQAGELLHRTVRK